MLESEEFREIQAINAHLAAQINVFGRIAERLTIIIEPLNSIVLSLQGIEELVSEISDTLANIERQRK